jgi:hypothetical protein
MEHALPRTWSLCMTSENHGTVGPAGCTFSHAPEKHERVLVVEALAGAHAPVAEFKGYVDGQPAVTWFDRDNMPRVGTKLFAAPVEGQAGQVAVQEGWISIDDTEPPEHELIALRYWPYGNSENPQAVTGGRYIDGTYYNDEGDEMHPPSHWCRLPYFNAGAAALASTSGERQEGGAA